ncbi:MAG TPA: porin family protein [Devosiaceae bacterium]
MRLARPIAIAAFLIPAFALPAAAADAIAYGTSAPSTEVPVASTGFDWNGFYAGVYGAGQFNPGEGNQYGVGVDLGVTAQYDFYLLGAEVSATALSDGDGAGASSFGQVLARGGVLVTDDVAVYAAAGYGLDLGPADENQWLLGGGVEMSITDNVSLRAQYLHGFTDDGVGSNNQITFGANYHF